MAAKIISMIVLVAALLSISLVVQASTVPIVKEVPNEREGRFYGFDNSQASAIAVANSGSNGYGGYPYGGGLGISTANAAAIANSGSLGYGK